MSLNMMYFVQRLLMDNGKCAGCQRTDQQRTDQPWCIGHRDGVDIVPGAISVSQRFVDDRVDDLKV